MRAKIKEIFNKKTIKKVAVLMMGTMFLAGTPTVFDFFCETNDIIVPTTVKEDSQIGPLFVAISDCNILLSLESSWG